MERMMDTFGATVSRALLESFYATPSTEGLSVIFNRCLAHVCWSSAHAASARPLHETLCRDLVQLMGLHALQDVHGGGAHPEAARLRADAGL